MIRILALIVVLATVGGPGVPSVLAVPPAAGDESEEAFALVRIGSSWFFFHPATDEELLVR